jgi:hypothetical protein
MSSPDFDSLAPFGNGQGPNGDGNGFLGSLLGGDVQPGSGYGPGVGSAGNMSGSATPLATAGTNIMPVNRGMGAGGSQMASGSKPMLSQLLGSLFGLSPRQPQQAPGAVRRPIQRPAPRPITRAPGPTAPIAGIGRSPVKPVAPRGPGQGIGVAGGLQRVAPRTGPVAGGR